MAKWQVALDLIVIAAAHPRLAKVSRFHQNGNDPLSGPLSNTYPSCNFSKPDLGIRRNAYQYMAVVRQKRPILH
jgi:hypothetical protein